MINYIKNPHSLDTITHASHTNISAIPNRMNQKPNTVTAAVR
jgi:hypothetical protein